MEVLSTYIYSVVLLTWIYMYGILAWKSKWKYTLILTVLVLLHCMVLEIYAMT